MEETEENHRPAASQWQTWSHNIVSPSKAYKAYNTIQYKHGNIQWKYGSIEKTTANKHQ